MQLTDYLIQTFNDVCIKYLQVMLKIDHLENIVYNNLVTYSQVNKPYYNDN